VGLAREWHLRIGAMIQVDGLGGLRIVGLALDPEDVAYAMAFLVSEEAGRITGQTPVVDGGQTLPESGQAA